MEILDFHIDERGQVSFELRMGQQEWSRWLQKAGQEMEKNHTLQTAGNQHMKILYQTAAALAQEEAVRQVCTERGLLPVSRPVTTVVTADVTGFDGIVRFANYPRVKDFAYRGLSAVKPHRVIREEDIDREAEHFRKNHLKVYETDREARTGDIVEVAFEGTSGGKPFPYDHSEKSRFLLGSGQLFAGLDAQLAGHAAGDVLHLSLTMPKDFHRNEIAGLTLDLTVRLKGVWARDLQEMSDAFVRENVRGCETVQDFRRLLRSRLESAYDHQAERIYQRNLETALANALTTPVPVEMVQTNFERYLMGLAAAAKESGKTAEALLAEEGKTLDTYKQEILRHAREQVLFSVAVDYIAEKEGLSASEAEMDAWLRKTAQEMDVAPAEAEGMAGGRESIAEEIIRRKVMHLISTSARPEIRDTALLDGEDPSLPVLVNY